MRNKPFFHSTHPLNSCGCLPLAEYSSQKASVEGTYVIPSKDLLAAQLQKASHSKLCLTGSSPHPVTEQGEL